MPSNYSFDYTNHFWYSSASTNQQIIPDLVVQLYT
jgi:hypothetical protein